MMTGSTGGNKSTEVEALAGDKNGNATQPKPPQKRSRIRPWVRGAVTFLTAISCIAAAFSAFYSSQSVEAAIAGVNTEAKNEAFASLVSASKSFCKMSLSEVDQSATIAEIGNRVGLLINYDAINQNIDKQTMDNYRKEYRERKAEIFDKVDIYKIYEEDEKFSAIEEFIYSFQGRGFKASFLFNGKFYGDVKLALAKSNCARAVKNMVYMYKASNLDEGYSYVRRHDAFPIPISSTKNTEKIMLDWGLSSEVELLKVNGYMSKDGNLTSGPDGSDGAAKLEFNDAVSMME